MHHRLPFFCVTFLLFCSASFLPLSPAYSDEEKWYPTAVEINPQSFSPERVKNIVEYSPLANSSTKWKVCVSFPHMKDSYWLAVNYGIVDEAKRLGIEMRLFHAGGYDKLKLQIKQIQKCVEQGAQAVIIAAISYEGLNPLIDELHQKGIPVIDLVNGVSSQKVSARSLVSFAEMGFVTGNYLVQLYANSKEPIKVAWFPGPQDAGWVKDGDQGFQSVLKGTNITITSINYGDTGKNVQSYMLEKTLDATPDINYIVGTAVTAEVAVKILKERGLDNKIKVISYYFTPAIYRAIKQNDVVAAPTDSPVIQGRIALNQVVRILEGKEFFPNIGPVIHMIDNNNIPTFDKKTSMAPFDYKATFLINE